MKVRHFFAGLCVLAIALWIARLRPEHDTGELERVEHQSNALSELRSDAKDSDAPPASSKSLARVLEVALRGAAGNGAGGNEPTPAAVDVKTASPTTPLVEDMTGLMNARFSAETRDYKWSGPSGDKLRDSASALMSDGRSILDVDCRATLCRMTVRYNGVDDYRAFVRSAFMEGTGRVWSGPTFSTLIDEHEGGPVTSVSYMLRDGESFVVSRRD